MNTKFLTTFAVVAFSALTTFHAQAVSVPLVVDAKLTLLRQGDDGGSGSVETSSIDKAKAGTVDLLNLVADALTTTLPAGAKLVLIDYEHFEIWDANDMVLFNNFDDILYFDYGDYLEKGKENTDTAQQTFTYVFASTIHFDDGSGNYFDFTGVTEEKYSQTAPNGDGIAKAKDSFKFSGSGDGVIDGELVILNGTFTGKGATSFW